MTEKPEFRPEDYAGRIPSPLNSGEKSAFETNPFSDVKSESGPFNAVEDTAVANLRVESSPPRTRQHRREKGVSITGFVLSIAGFVTCGATSLVGVVFSIVGLQSEPRGLAAAGFILNLLGIVMLVSSVALFGGMASMINRLGPQNWQYQMALSDTSNSMGQASSLIGDQWEKSGEVPDVDEGSDIAASVQDGWSTPLRYQTDGSSFTLISDGPDRTFDTADDIVFGPFLSVEEAHQIGYYETPFFAAPAAPAQPAAETDENEAEDGSLPSTGEEATPSIEEILDKFE
ncbi:MAG: DUF4190 domain-containing protein [Planctomycetota bacterium]